MSEPKFDIHISTSADTKGVEQAKQALAELSRETKKLTTASEAQTAALSAQKEAAEEQAAAVQEQSAAFEAQADALDALLKAAEEQAAAAEAQAAAAMEEEAALAALLAAEKEHKAALEAEAAATTKADIATQANIRTLASMEAELEELSEAMNHMDVASDAFANTRDEIGELEAEIGRLKSGESKAAEETEKAITAMEGFVGVLKGAEDGGSGMLNSLPALVTALGGSAGLAGGVGLAVFAVEKLIKAFDKLDYDGTWVGDLKKGITELATGMSEAGEQAQSIADAPQSWRKAGAEAAEEYRESLDAIFSEGLARLKDESDSVKFGARQRLSEKEHEEEMFRINNPNLAEHGTAEWAENEKKHLESKARQEQLGREAGKSLAVHDYSQAKNNETALTEKARMEGQKLDGLKQYAELEQSVAKITAIEEKERLRAERIRMIKLGSYLAPKLAQDALMAYVSANPVLRSPEQIAQDTALKKQAEEQMKSLPKPILGETAGEAIAAQQTRKQAADDAAAAAAGEAKKAEQNKIEVSAQTAQEDELDKLRNEQARHRLDTTVAQHKKAEEEKLAQQQAESFKAAAEGKVGPPDPAMRFVSDEKIQETQKGLANMSRRGLHGKSHGEVDAKERPEAFTNGLGMLNNLVGDGKGDTAAEVAVIEKMRQDIVTGAANRAEALEQALRSMRELQDGGSQMERQLISTLNAYGNKLSQLASDLRDMENRANYIEAGKKW